MLIVGVCCMFADLTVGAPFSLYWILQTRVYKQKVGFPTAHYTGSPNEISKFETGERKWCQNRAIVDQSKSRSREAAKDQGA
jgi:hypothetical protein